MARQEDDLGLGSKSGSPTEPSTTIPKKDYVRVHVDGESEQRRKLLESVSVDERGVARSAGLNGAESLLVAVKINDEKEASLVPFQVGQDLDGGKVIQMALPADRPSRVGFFLGQTNSPDEISAAIRLGLYPGVPLLTQGGFTTLQEVLLGVRGVAKGQEETWAEHINLFTELGFEPERSRGFFYSSSKSNSFTDVWETKPLLLFPREWDDTLEHFDRQQVEESELQALYYSTTAKPTIPYPDIGATREMFGDSLRFGGTRDAIRGGLGFGFGRSGVETGSTTEVVLKGLEGAFRVKAVPEA